MKHRLLFLALAAGSPSFAQMAPPPIPSGPISYTSVSAPADDQNLDTIVEAASYEQLTLPTAPVATRPIAISEIQSSEYSWDLDLNLYTLHYNVRGMGVTNSISDHGYSSFAASYTSSNRNLFQAGLHQRFLGELGRIWGSNEALADGYMSQWGYRLGKEVFPNAMLEVGYNLRYGTLEGFFAKQRGKSAHSIAQDINLTLSYDDQQEGFFGGVQLGYGFSGLTGWYYDLAAGYRQTEVFTSHQWGLDLEYLVGIAGSSGYWTGNADGVDAYRARVSFQPYAHSGLFGRDSNWSVTPWVEMTTSGDNDKTIDRDFGGVVDGFQINVGIDISYEF